MASHPYISGPGSVTQMIGLLRRTFPATVTSDTVKKHQLAPKNESYVINALQFLGLVDDEGKRTDEGLSVLSLHDEEEFRSAFGTLIENAYADLFELKAGDAWTMNKDQLIAYFRTADKTSDIIGGRQAGVFIALRELAGHASTESAAAKTKASTGPKTRTVVRKPKVVEPLKVDNSDKGGAATVQQRGDMALTVRIEINLPAEGTQETYDAIFKSIKANLYP